MSKRAMEDEVLVEIIGKVYSESRETYGYRRIRDELADDYDIHLGRDRVARLMRRNGLHGLTRRKFRAPGVAY